MDKYGQSIKGTYIPEPMNPRLKLLLTNAGKLPSKILKGIIEGNLNGR